jgi:hypothetical protein
VWDLKPSGVSLTFEQPFRDNRARVVTAIRQAHAEGLRVLLVPHLWVESGEWRGQMDPGGAEAWQEWSKAYGAFVREWAKVAAESNADMFALGVELRSWVTTTHAESFADTIRSVRAIYPGLITYAANWDDADRTVILGELDVIGINAFFPLAESHRASPEELLRHSRKIALDLASLAQRWGKPILFTEFGYTARTDTAVRPWEWPEHLSGIELDETAQADAYQALLTPLLEAPWFAGFFVWRMFSDWNDTSQEPDWGFSPLGKQAEFVLRDAYRAHWASDGPLLNKLPVPGAGRVGAPSPAR